MKKTLLVFVAGLWMAGSVAAQEVTGLAGWNIYLDPGHSRTENVGVFGYSEANKVLRVGLALREMLLTKTDIDTVYISRTNDDVSVGLSQRSDHANSLAAAWFHSIHSDAGPASANSTLMLWGQRFDGTEKVPSGGQRMSGFMLDVLTRAMRIETRGSWGDCSFYSRFTTPCTPSFPGPWLSVNRRTAMPSELSEAGFHTNPRQNQLNMNAAWKRLEAQALYWAILDFHGLARPPVRIVTGTVTDLEDGRPINGARVTVGDSTFTTDTFASLFQQYANDPNALRNGFYYLDGLDGGTLPMTVEADDYAPFAGDVTMIDTFFTFVDVALISTVPPTVAASSPEPDDGNFRITDPIVIDFSRRMDTNSVEAALLIAPETNGTITWQDDDRRLVFEPDTLLPRTNYTLTIDGSAQGSFGDPFDGNGDGTGGDAFTLNFLTSFPDTAPPRLIASDPRVNARDVELRPIITVAYDEPVEPASLEGRVRLVSASGQSPVAGRFVHYLVGEQSVVSFFPQEELAPNQAYFFFIDPGVRDLFLNEETVLKRVRFTTGSTRFVTTGIDDFETDLDRNWWVPQQSGSTTGIVTDSTNAAPDSSVVNLLTESTTAFRLDYGWDAQATDPLIRIFLNGGPPRSAEFDSTYVVQAYVFGDGSGNQFRFALDDRVPNAAAGNHEVSPWYTVDWRGWRLVSWDMNPDGTGTWLGDGTLDGTLRFDSIQLTYTPDSPAFGTFYVDDLRLAKKRDVATALESVPEVPGAFTLAQNYPNPFNTSTTLRFDLPTAADVTLRIYNTLGAEVATLAERTRFTAGTHTMVWNAEGLPSGVYFGRIFAGTASRSIKLMLVK